MLPVWATAASATAGGLVSLFIAEPWHEIGDGRAGSEADGARQVGAGGIPTVAGLPGRWRGRSGQAPGRLRPAPALLPASADAVRDLALHGQVTLPKIARGLRPEDLLR